MTSSAKSKETEFMTKTITKWNTQNTEDVILGYTVNKIVKQKTWTIRWHTNVLNFLPMTNIIDLKTKPVTGYLQDQENLKTK